MMPIKHSLLAAAVAVALLAGCRDPRAPDAAEVQPEEASLGNSASAAPPAPEPEPEPVPTPPAPATDSADPDTPAEATEQADAAATDALLDTREALDPAQQAEFASGAEGEPEPEPEEDDDER